MGHRIRVLLRRGSPFFKANHFPGDLGGENFRTTNVWNRKLLSHSEREAEGEREREI